MIQRNILELAKQGDTNAINTLVSQWLNLPRITPKTSFKQNCLQIMLESIEVPVQQLVVPLICDGLINLGIQSFKNVKIYGRVTGEDFPDWQQELELKVQLITPSSIAQANVDIVSSNTITTTDAQLSLQKPSFLGSFFGAVSGTAGAVGSAAVQAGQAVAGAAVGIGGAIGGAAFQATQIVGQALAEAKVIDSINKKLNCDLAAIK